jgi:hypothetical protein
VLEVPYTSPGPLWSTAQYNAARQLGAAATPATCPDRPWWYLALAAAAAGAVTYYATKPKKKGARG